MRKYLRSFAVTLPLLVASACSDMSTNPTSSDMRSPSDRVPAFDYTAGGRFGFGDQQTTFVVTPDGGSFSINRLLTVDFPAGAICDPATSTYGPGEWDNDCAVISEPITITATTRLTSNGLQVDFQPSLRFSPSKQVTLSTDLFSSTLRTARSLFGAAPSTLRPLAFSYTSSLGAEPVADYATDSSLVTRVDLQSGKVWRRVKHFSGYYQGSGAACTPSANDPDCIAIYNK